MSILINSFLLHTSDKCNNMYKRKIDGYRPLNVPNVGNAMPSFGAPAIPHVAYPVVPLMQQPAFGKQFIHLQVWPKARFDECCPAQGYWENWVLQGNI